MTDQALAIVQPQSRFLSPVATIAEAMNRYALMAQFTERVMKVDHDYGKVPGTDKPTLLKPGAEKLCSLFGLSPRFEILEKEMDWTGERHGGEPFFYLQYLCSMYSGDQLIAQGVGSCNSWEKKYRYRNGERVCPQCGKPTIIKGKAEYGGGFICFAKKGGCGAKYQDNDPAIVGQQTGQVKNPDPSDIVNTVDKMAQKRALVASTLIATNASDHFTQDMEDFINAAEWHEVEPPQPSQQAQHVSRPEPQPMHSTPAAVKQASIKTSKFAPIATIFAGTFPEYADKNGNPNMYHILGAVAKCGFAEVTDANVEAVKDAIYNRALEAHSSDHEKDIIDPRTGDGENEHAN